MSREPSLSMQKGLIPVAGADGDTKRSGASRVRTLLWVLLLFAVVVITNLAVNRLLAFLEARGSSEVLVGLTGLLVLSLIIYTVLLSIPFVPGVEIGLFLLMSLGAPVAPYVYLATIAGLALSFCLGRYVPTPFLCRLLAGLGLRRACDFLERAETMSQKERVTQFSSALPGWLGPRIIRFRYLALAVALNIPGNSVVGGGGGLVLAAGLSRIFSPAATLLTLSIAVSPVALAVYFFGSGVLNQ